MRRLVCDTIRFIYNIGLEDFCLVLGLELEMTISEKQTWIKRFKLLRKDFIEGFFSLDDSIQAKLWAYGVQKAEQYERRHHRPD